MTKCVIVGGGLAGLTAAALVAKQGLQVTLYEEISSLGGRARTAELGRFFFNQGPHALYLGGAGAPILKDLGVTFKGRAPGSKAIFAEGSRLSRLVLPFPGLLTFDFLSLGGKLDLIGFLLGVKNHGDTARDDISFDKWLEDNIKNEGTRKIISALARVSTYCADLDLLSARAGLHQIYLALKGVMYLDGGWQQLVDQLAKIASDRGAVLHSHQKVKRVLFDEKVSGIELHDGIIVNADYVILACDPRSAAELIAGGATTPKANLADELARWKAFTPVRAASLDTALKQLPLLDRPFALGIDHPFYFSVHSNSAQLGPPGFVVIHASKYLRCDDKDTPQHHEAQLEGWMDLIQPGWRLEIERKRFLPNMTVAHCLPRYDTGGMKGRAKHQVPGVANLFVAGDWVGAEGLLADGSLSSAKRAAQLIAESVKANSSKAHVGQPVSTA